MKTLNRSPHYLVRNPHSFCCRFNVPKDLQRVVGRQELRYSLKTGYVGVARVVHKSYRGKPAPVRLESPKAKLYRTVLRKGAKGGPNFAGHYT
jgi:hypothetical protein